MKREMVKREMVKRPEFVPARCSWCCLLVETDRGLGAQAIKFVNLYERKPR